MQNWRKKRSLMRRYDQSARVYDAQYREEQLAKIQTALNNLALNKSDLILDAGCGTGMLFQYLVQSIGFIVAIDISRGLLREAKRKADDYGIIELVLADVDNLPLPDQTFDKIFAITLMQNVANPKATLREINRVSKPHAKMAITGLRKSFTKEGFLTLLEQANLRVESVQLDKPMREYVAVCSKMLR